MKNTPLFSQEFHIHTLNKKRRTSQQKLADHMVVMKEQSFEQLSECFRRFIPKNLLKKNEKGDHSRNRIFSKENTFWAFFSQVLDSDGGCMEVITKLRAFASLKLQWSGSVSTGSYCKARQKLSEKEMAGIFDHTASVLLAEEKRTTPFKRRVIVVDGTGVTAADTPKNQAIWPQQKQQKPGCGFPSLRICACFSLETGGMMSFKEGNKKSHELRLFREQQDTFEQDDILLGDKMFCSYFDLATLAKRGVDSVVTLWAKKRKPIREAHAIKRLGENDYLIRWKKPVWQKKAAYSKEEWIALPDTLTLRQIKVTVEEKGFRVKSFYIVTTLLDPIDYPAEEIAELYFRRWDVELNFADIKTTMKMDTLRCKSPSMVRKEMLMHFIAYNGVRWLICEAAKDREVDRCRISFKGAIQSLRQWEPQFNQAKLRPAQRRCLIEKLYASVVENIVPYRPNRKEPRCIKRRPKPYQLLTEHRSTMKETEHRSKYRAKAA